MNNMEHHELEECTKKMENCEHCNEVLLRCDMQLHDDGCPDMVIKCKWAKYKCPFESKRKDMYLHDQECKLDAVGLLADMLHSKVDNLQDENRIMQEKIELQNRRLRSFEFDRVPDHGPPMDLSELPNHPRYTGPPDIDPNNVPARPSLEWLISLSDSQETKILRLQNAMSEMEARHSTLVYNETIGIKNTITEMRSNLQTMNMYVRWLVQWRQQEIRQHGGNRPSPSGSGGSSGGDGGSGGGRRLSDLTREMTRL
jgi:TNF receptor-associated factor 5